MRCSLIKQSPDIFMLCDDRRHIGILKKLLQATAYRRLAKFDLFIDEAIDRILRPMKLPQCCCDDSRKNYSTTFLEYGC